MVQQIPEEITIGEKLRHKQGGAGFEGNIRAEWSISNTIIGERINIFLHEKGIQIREYNSKSYHAIPFSALLDLDLTGRNETAESGKVRIGRLILGLLTILTLGIIAAIYLGDRGENESGYENKYQYYLHVKYRDPKTNTVQTILVSGSKFRIRRFVAKYKKLKAGYEGSNRILQ